MSKTSVSLSILPKDKEFEEFVAAYFQTAGYYVERHIIERAIDEVLELDVILTNYTVTPPRLSIAEAKSGEWGFPDIFKLRGWMDYLGIDSAWLVTQIEKPHSDFYCDKAKTLDVRLLQLKQLTDLGKSIPPITADTPAQDVDVECWRYSYWTERHLLALLNSKKKSIKSAMRYNTMAQYHFEVNSGIFFTENIVTRLRMLYDNFRAFPKLSAKVANELSGGDFSMDHGDVPKEVFAKTFYECSLTDLAISCFIENCSRLAILKNAVDFTIFSAVGDKLKTEASFRVLGTKTPSLVFLPTSFHDALQSLKDQPYFHLYPLFWQWFLWLFGGFILLDYEEREYELLSKKTGIPVGEVPNALKVFDVLFPTSDRWLTSVPTSNIRFLKMNSVPFMGVGANYRRLVYAENREWSGLGLSGNYTRDDLIKWNNLLVDLLDKKFK